MRKGFTNRIMFCFAFCAFFSISVRSQCSGGEIYQIKGSNVYWAAVKKTCFIEYAARQRNNNWCWAACIQMVLNYQGVNVTQEQIVEKVFGYRVDRPANTATIAEAAQGYWNGGIRMESKVEYPKSNNCTAETFINDLVYKYPLIVGLSIPNQDIGHAYVLTGISFVLDNNGNRIPKEVKLRDPWPGNESPIKISWSEFTQRCFGIVHIYPSNN